MPRKNAKVSAIQSAKDAFKNYTFFNPKLRDNAYKTGEIYDEAKVARSQEEWNITSKPNSYLQFVKNLSPTWPHLRLLADFMEVSTTPVRWPELQVPGKGSTEREKRAKKTNVSRLDYLENGEVDLKSYIESDELKAALITNAPPKDGRKCHLRLFVVEDLSRDVIEYLGSSLDIEPSFFREQLFDYAWCNVRDRWIDPPDLRMVTKSNRWVPIRFVTARYFKTTSSFQEGFQQASDFNVSRRPDDDQNNKSVWDDGNAIVGITRTRASFWFKSHKGEQIEAVGVLLVDPTIKAGTPLWYGYRNWEGTPSMNANIPNGPPRDSLYNDVIYWAQRTDVFQTATALNTPASMVHVPIQALLHIVCAEWFTIADYIKTRLGQIEWEISSPNEFLDPHSDIDVALKKLHVWRRLVPLYREELTETLERVFKFPCHTPPIALGTTLPSSYNSANNTPSTPTASTLAAAATLPIPTRGPITAFRNDFARALSYMEEHQQRIDRLTSVVTAIISIQDSRRAQEDNRNVARLTWLATFFIPLSFITGLFSMVPDITQLGVTFKWYFAAAIPLAVLSLGAALAMNLPPKVHRATVKVRNWLGLPAKKKTS